MQNLSGILYRAYCIFLITVGLVDPQQWFNSRNITSWSLLGYLIMSSDIPPGFWRELEKNEECQIDPP